MESPHWYPTSACGDGCCKIASGGKSTKLGRMDVWAGSYSNRPDGIRGWIRNPVLANCESLGLVSCASFLIIGLMIGLDYSPVHSLVWRSKGLVIQR